MSAREKLMALATERGLYLHATYKAGRVEMYVGHDTEPLVAVGAAPTEDAACAALLAKLEPHALPRLGKTPREEVRALLRWTYQADIVPGNVRAVAGADEDARESWLLAFPDEPARTMHPAAVALVEAMALVIGDEQGPVHHWSLFAIDNASCDDRAFAAWLAAGRPVWLGGAK